jgi:hypothetical protein
VNARVLALAQQMTQYSWAKEARRRYLPGRRIVLVPDDVDGDLARPRLTNAQARAIVDARVQVLAERLRNTRNGGPALYRPGSCRSCRLVP